MFLPPGSTELRTFHVGRAWPCSCGNEEAQMALYPGVGDEKEPHGWSMNIKIAVSNLVGQLHWQHSREYCCTKPGAKKGQAAAGGDLEQGSSSVILFAWKLYMRPSKPLRDERRRGKSEALKKSSESETCEPSKEPLRKLKWQFIC